jgi:hypothetical protein
VNGCAGAQWPPFGSPSPTSGTPTSACAFLVAMLFSTFRRPAVPHSRVVHDARPPNLRAPVAAVANRSELVAARANPERVAAPNTRRLPIRFATLVSHRAAFAGGVSLNLTKTSASGTFCPSSPAGTRARVLNRALIFFVLPPAAPYANAPLSANFSPRRPCVNRPDVSLPDSRGSSLPSTHLTLLQLMSCVPVAIR